MPQFKYAARTADGKRVTGDVEALTERDAVAKLRTQNLTIMSLSGEAKAAAAPTRRPLWGRVKMMEMVIFTRQMSTMVAAGIPLLECLEIMEEQTDNVTFKMTLGEVVASVRSGSDLSAALAQHPRIFPPLYVNMVRAGEASGQLDIILTRLAEYLESTAQLRREIRAAMTYPVVALSLVLSITFFLLTYIVPKFQEIFTQMEVALPLPTRIVLLIGITLRDSLLWVVISLAAIVVVLGLYTHRTKMGRWQLDWFKLHVWVFGPLFHKVALSRFAKTFSTLIKSGVPILASLDIVGGTTGNVLVTKAIENARENVRQGETLAEPLASSGLFPPMVTRMISVGERSGALENLLEKISEFYDQQVTAAVESLTSLIEPILIAIMGVIVGTIVLSIFLPIIKLQEVLATR
ncbi:MAG: type II secretion system F family protein [Planctomycetota bacterium]